MKYGFPTQQCFASIKSLRKVIRGQKLLSSVMQLWEKRVRSTQTHISNAVCMATKGRAAKREKKIMGYTSHAWFADALLTPE